MQIVFTADELRKQLSALRNEGCTIGLVPTMGALHAGHASLVERSVCENGATVVSVFVNPTQFNDPKDLACYPRTPEADFALLERIGAALVFAPTVEEMYPEPDTRTFSYPPTDSVMEGALRPGHFNGVCQIVSKLFGLVRPDRAYFGEKDYQQIAVVSRMTTDLGFDIDIRPCPIVRAASGLALSSRNALLSETEKETASYIYRTLKESLAWSAALSVTETARKVIDTLNAVDGLEVEYFQIADGRTLEPVSAWSQSDSVVGCITVYCGARPVRLIDNIRYK
ncbi:MAG: pantoate--beta-alanine ligase [Prevotellaceae bacterium]|nr:pantoate--beta-alanine ligase [Prevotellaceae bacterium]